MRRRTGVRPGAISPRTVWTRTIWTRTVWALFAGIATVSSLLVIRRPPSDRLADLHIYYGAAQAVQSGQPLYGYAAGNGGPFTYPPFAMVVLRPITAIPEPVLRVVWLVLTCAAVAAIAMTVGPALTAAAGPTQSTRRAGRRASMLVVAATACAVLLSAPAQSNLRFGQVSVFIVLLALVDAVGLTPARYRGLLVGVAAAIKLTPLLFVAFFLLARRRADAARAGAAFVAAAGLGAAVLPSDSWQYWTGTMVRTSRIGDLAALGNQSVHGILLRAGVEPGALPLVWAVLIVALCGTALLRARRLQLDGRPGHASVLVGCATVAASPVSWTHHQIWTVLAAMLLVASHGPLRRAAGTLLLVAMTVSLGVLLRDASTYPGVQFLFENARILGTVTVCLAGFGAAAAVATATGTGSVASADPASTGSSASTGPSRGTGCPVGLRSLARVGLRAATVAAATLACFALLPLPAGADPTFKAYAMDDAGNSRYFFVSRAWATAHIGAAAPDVPWLGTHRFGVVRFGVLREKTKVRVNGVVDASVARLEYQSAPGGRPRTIPLLQVSTGKREFSFRSANLAHGKLVAYGTDGRTLATFTEELDP